MSDDSPAVRLCLNCSAELIGPYCAQCGQRDQHRRVPLKHLLHDVLHDLWHFDAKVFSTLWLLIRRPGFLAADYLEGRRVRHVPPFRLYVVVSFVSFALLALISGGVKVSTRTPPASAVSSTAETNRAPDIGPSKPSSDPAWVLELNRRGQLAAQHPEALKKAFLGGLSKVMFLLMPAFAGLLFLLHARKTGTYFVDHMILSLHFHTVAFLVILALRALSLAPESSGGGCLALLLFAAPPVWLTLALQHLHRRGWFRSFAKMALALGLYGLMVSAALLAVLWLSLPS